MKNIINRGFSQIPLNTFVADVTLIISKLSGNADFPTTNPTLAALTAQLDALEAAMLIPDPVAQEEAVKAARATLEQMLDDLADNLEASSNMDPVKLSTTGFPMRKETTQTSDPPPIPGDCRLRRTGTSGEVQLVCDASERARGYDVQTAPDPDAGPWTPYDVFSSTRKMVLGGLEHAKDIWVRVRAIGPNNTKSGWSNPVRILVD